MAQNRHFSFVSTKALALAFQETFRAKYLGLCWEKPKAIAFLEMHMRFWSRAGSRYHAHSLPRIRRNALFTLVYLRHSRLELLRGESMPCGHALAKPCSLAFGKLA
jgi:hypothetical protein